MQKTKILIVDDDTSVVLVISNILVVTQLYDVVVALDGVNALKMAETSLPDLILMDWELPGIDGNKAVQYLKANVLTKNIPIIMITGNSDSKVLEEAFEAGVVHFLRKPFVQIELLSLVKATLKTQALNTQIVESVKRELSLSILNNIRYEEFRQKYLNGINHALGNFVCIHTECRQKLEKLVVDLKIDIPTSLHNQLERIWKNIDTDFMKNLNEKHPNLTPSEIKMCSYLRLNLSTKDIATLAFLDPNSVRIARTRLRKKLNLSGNVNLVGYIHSL